MPVVSAQQEASGREVCSLVPRRVFPWLLLGFPWRPGLHQTSEQSGQVSWQNMSPAAAVAGHRGEGLVIPTEGQSNSHIGRGCRVSDRASLPGLNPGLCNQLCELGSVNVTFLGLGEFVDNTLIGLLQGLKRVNMCEALRAVPDTWSTLHVLNIRT